MSTRKFTKVGIRTDAVVLNFVPRQRKEKPRKAKCSLCDRIFTAHGKFERFCSSCREESELYHFYETLSAG